MKFKKIILPMMAMIFAIGMAFATVNPEPKPEMSDSESYATMYVNVDGNWHEIKVDCQTGTANCTVEFSEDPFLTPYQVYNTPSINDEALGSAAIKRIEGPVPSN